MLYVDLRRLVARDINPCQSQVLFDWLDFEAFARKAEYWTWLHRNKSSKARGRK